MQNSAEHNTSVRIADDSPLLSWLPRFAAQVKNKFRIGKDEKTSEMWRTGRRWRRLLAQFGVKVWFRKLGEDGCQFICNSHDSVHDQEWSCARQELDKTLSDAWESTN